MRGTGWSRRGLDPLQFGWAQGGGGHHRVRRDDHLPVFSPLGQQLPFDALTRLTSQALAGVDSDPLPTSLAGAG